MTFPVASAIIIKHSANVYRGIAQLVEQRSPKPRAVSSKLTTPAMTHRFFGTCAFCFTPSAVSRYDPSRENSVWSAPQSATNAKFKIFFPLKMARAKRKPFKIVSAPQTAHLYPLLQKIAFSANLCLTTDRLSDIIEHVPAVRCRTNLSDHGPVAQLVRAPACHAGGRRFEPDPGRHLLL